MRVDDLLTLNEISNAVNSNPAGVEIEAFEMQDPMRNLTFPLRFEAMVIAWVVSGHGRVGIDLREYELEPGSLLVIHPRNYVYSADTTEITVRVLMCSQGVVENVLPKLTDLMPLLMHHRAEPVEKLDETSQQHLLDFYSSIYRELQRPRTPFLKQKLICILQAAMFEMLDIHAAMHTPRPQVKSRKEEIMARFILLISENFREHRQVSFYSDQLCISAKHLSSVVKELSTFTAGEWIERYVTVEAKVLLRTTDLTIQEIATRLNFTNQSFFGKYFRHQTGMSPSAYRKSASE